MILVRSMILATGSFETAGPQAPDSDLSNRIPASARQVQAHFDGIPFLVGRSAEMSLS
jgi:hypothetical protein